MYAYSAGAYILIHLALETMYIMPDAIKWVCPSTALLLRWAFSGRVCGRGGERACCSWCSGCHRRGDITPSLGDTSHHSFCHYHAGTVDLLYAAAAAVWKARRNNDLLNLFCVSRVWVCIGVGVRDNYTPECVPPLANKRVCGLCIVRSVELRDREGGAGRRHKDGDGGPNKSHARRPTTTNARGCVYSLARTRTLYGGVLFQDTSM